MSLTNKLSERTKTVIPRTDISDLEDYYPDTQPATPTEYKDTGETPRLDRDVVPTTTADMSAMFMWEMGDDIYGTDAYANEAQYRYRKDIRKAWGKQDAYKDIYLNTFKKISDELKRFESI